MAIGTYLTKWVNPANILLQHREEKGMLHGTVTPVKELPLVNVISSYRLALPSAHSGQRQRRIVISDCCIIYLLPLKYSLYGNILCSYFKS